MIYIYNFNFSSLKFGYWADHAVERLVERDVQIAE